MAKAILAVMSVTAFLLLMTTTVGVAQVQRDQGGLVVRRPPEEAIRYLGPQAYRDPADPFQAVRWTSGLYVPGRLRLNQGTRGLSPVLEYDLESRQILLSYTANGQTILPPVVYTPGDYSVFAMRQELRRQWVSGNEQSIAHSTDQAQAGLLNVSLPFEVPFTEKLFGPGAPSLQVTGREQITISGTSTWVVGRKNNETGGSSIFPKLDMRQNLNVNLTGTIGTKLTVAISQNSEALTPLENAIRIRYRGEEDEVIQAVELGNTNLSLPATQYVSFSARQEGLFGVKTTAKVGDVSLTAIASRQEGEPGAATYTGGSSETRSLVRDVDYDRGRYFFLSDPDSAAVPRVDFASIQVFLDDYDSRNDIDLGAEPTLAVLDPTQPGVGPSYSGTFHRLQEEVDYRLLNADTYFFPVIVLSSRLSQYQTLAVAYRDTLNGLPREVGDTDTSDSLLVLKMVRPSSATWGQENLALSEWAAVRRYEMKSVYNLGARNIEPGSFKVDIARTNDVEVRYSQENYLGNEIPYLQILGLDQRDNETQALTPDGRVDDQFIDYENGLLFFPDLRPFDPSLVDIQGHPSPPYPGLWRTRSWPTVPGVARPDTLGWRRAPDGTPIPSPGAAEETVPQIYDVREDRVLAQQSTFTKYTIEASFRTTVTTIPMGGLGAVLEGSETVRINGEVMQRGRDYTVDYGLNEISLRRPLAATDDLVVTWSVDSPFSQGSRSLLGASLSYEAGSNYTWSTSWLHESRGLPDRRPRLGQEPTKTTVGDLSGSWSLAPWAMTDLMDALPGVKTNVPSRMDFQGALGLSFPNPNSKGTVWIDDMEGAKIVTSAQLIRRSWTYSSIPSDVTIKAPGTPFPVPIDLDARHRGKLYWFAPQTVRRGDLNPELEEFERNDQQSVLEIVYIPTNDPGTDPLRRWGGLVTPLSVNGENLSEAQYIEVWINDFVPYEERDRRRGELRIDIGKVSEDAVWDPLLPAAAPNGTLDYEDRDKSGGVIAQEEDFGLDGIPSVLRQEEVQTGRPGSTPGDPAGDDRRADVQEIVRGDPVALKVQKIAGINGTEDNQRDDSEDLNANYRLDVDNDYIEYTVDLTDEAFVDVTRDYGTVEDRERNGWRAYRIPIRSLDRRLVGNPDLTSVLHMRMWFRGIEDPTDTLNVQIASAEVVANRWELLPVLDAAGQEVEDGALDALGAVYGVAVVNNKENQNDYTSPIPPERQDRVTEREQSLTLEFENFQAGHEFRAYRSFPDARDYTLYRTLEFFVAPRLDSVTAAADTVEFFARFGSNSATDTLSYYEISTRLTRDDPRLRADGWLEMNFPITDLTGIKVDLGQTSAVRPDSFLVGPDDLPGGLGARPRREIAPGILVTIRGAPSFSQIRQVSAGLRNVTEFPLAVGRVWFNEVRMGEVRRDKGWIGRASLNLAFADVLSLGGAVTMSDEDFVRLGQSRGSGNQDMTYNLNGGLNAHKFFEGLQVTAPVRASLRRSRKVPKFRANSDVEFTGVDSGRDITQSGTREANVTLGRAPRGRSPFLVANTLDGIRVNAGVSENFNYGTSQVDTVNVTRVGVTYRFNGPRTPLRILGFDTFLWPTTANLAWNNARTDRRTYTRDLADPTKLSLTSGRAQRSESLTGNLSFNPVRILTFSRTAQRDLIDANWQLPALLQDRPAVTLLGVNVGRETSHSNTVNVSWNPPFGDWFRPRVGWSGSYTQNTSPSLTREGYLNAAKNVDNGNNVNLALTIPIGRAIRELTKKKASPSQAETEAQRRERQQEHLERMQEIQRQQAEARRRAAGDSTVVGEDPEDGRPGQREGEPPEEKKDDSSSLRDFFTKVVSLGDIQTGATRTRRSSVSGITGNPDPLYQLGITQDPKLGEEIFPVQILAADSSLTTNFNASEGVTTTYRGNTSVVLFRTVTTDISFQHREDEATTNTTSRVQKDTTWPEVRFNWGTLQDRIPLIRNVFSDFRAVNSSYSRTTTKRGPLLNPDETVTITSAWNPLIQLEGTLKGSWRTRLRLNTNSAQTIVSRLGAPSISNRNTFNVTTSFAKTFIRRSEGGGNKNIDFSTDLSYTRTTNETSREGVETRSQGSDEFRWVNNATLRFTRTISGTFGLTFTQNRDLVARITTRSLGVSFTTGFNF